MNTILPDIFTGAAAEVDRRGHCKEAYEDSDGRICARYAIDVQFDQTDLSWPVVADEAYRFFASVVAGREVDSHAASVIEFWNDNDVQDSDHLAATFRLAADKAEAML